MATATIKIEGMTCGHCTSSVEEALGGLEGVEQVVADLDTGVATVTHNGGVDEAVMRELIEEIGFEAS